MAERKGVIVDLFNGQCGLCCYCQNKMTLKLGRKKTATVEHILPRSHGGKDEFNLAAACDDCNSERGNMPLLLYLAGRKYGMKYYKPKKKKAEVPSGLPKLPRKLQRRLGQNLFKFDKKPAREFHGLFCGHNLSQQCPNDCGCLIW